MLGGRYRDVPGARYNSVGLIRKFGKDLAIAVLAAALLDVLWPSSRTIEPPKAPVEITKEEPKSSFDKDQSTTITTECNFGCGSTSTTWSTSSSSQPIMADSSGHLLVHVIGASDLPTSVSGTVSTGTMVALTSGTCGSGTMVPVATTSSTGTIVTTAVPVCSVQGQ